MISSILDRAVNHSVSIDSIKFWFDIFNREIFENKLYEFDQIIVKRTRGYYGQCEHWYEWEFIDDEWVLVNIFALTMRESLDFKDYLGTLGHEMVHLYQAQIMEVEMLEPKSDPIFYEFQNKFSEFGINII